MKRRHASNEASTAGLHAYATPRTVHSKALEQWRDALTFKQAQEACTFQNSKLTFVVLQSGGLVDTWSAIRAGFLPIWGTEICPQHTQSPLQCSEIHRSRYCRENKQQFFWELLTKTKSLGNAFSGLHKYSEIQRPVLLGTSPKCVDFCLGGSKEGGRGATGCMMVDTARVILLVDPLIFCLEQSGEITKFQDEFQTTMQQL